MRDFKRNDKRIIRAWSLFDWANSAYALVITVAIFPAYYAQVVPPILDIFGFTIQSTALYAFAITTSYILIAILSPFLSGIADYGGRRLFFLKLFTVIGSLSCIGLFFFTGAERLYLGIPCFMIATIGFAGALVFYNSYLHIIVTKDLMDRVSAQGYAYGYIGSVILLLICLAIITYHDGLGLDKDLATRSSFLGVGIWWLGFSQWTFQRLPQDRSKPFTIQTVTRGWRELQHVWDVLKHERVLIYFLLSFFFYSAGVQTVLFLASTFAETELKFSTAELISLILILQIVAIGGAYFFAWVSKRFSNKVSLYSMLFIWLLICILGYFVKGGTQFYGIAAMVGLVMGGIQSQSRSTYSKLLSDDIVDVTSYFSFYDILEKLSIVLGTFSFGIIDQLTGGMRNSLLALGFFFVIGLLLLIPVRNEEGYGGR